MNDELLRIERKSIQKLIVYVTSQTLASSSAHARRYRVKEGPPVVGLARFPSEESWIDRIDGPASNGEKRALKEGVLSSDDRQVRTRMGTSAIQIEEPPAIPAS